MSDPSSPSGPPPVILNQPGFHLHADQGQKILHAMIALIVVASTVVILRLISRRLTRAGFWWDDLLMIIALSLAVAPCVCNIVAVEQIGFGKHIYVFSKAGGAEATTGLFHMLYFFQIFFTMATGITKLAILAFYRRIFPIAELRLILIVMTTVVGMYTVAFTTLLIFQCHPLRKFWEPEVHGHCVNPYHNLIISGSINTLLNFLVVCLPIPLLWRLRTSTRQKCVLTGIFLTAGFVCFVSIIRVVSYTKVDPADVTWNFVPVAIWSSVEPIVGICGACLPSLRPLIIVLFNNTAYRSFAATTSRTFRSNTSSSAIRSNPSQSKNIDSAFFARLEEQDANPSSRRLPWLDQKSPGGSYANEFDGHNITVYSGRGQPGRMENDAIEMLGRTSDAEPPKGTIRVKTEIFLSSSKRLDYNDRLY